MHREYASTGPANRLRVNVASASDVNYWCGNMTCSEGELKKAVDNVGAATLNVRPAVMLLKLRRHLRWKLPAG